MANYKETILSNGLIIYQNPITPKLKKRPKHQIRKAWDRTHLSKAERRGKTPKEIDQLRQLKWRALHERNNEA